MLNPERRFRKLCATEGSSDDLTAVLARLPAERGGALPPVTRANRDEIEAMLPPGAVHQGWFAIVDPLEPAAIETVAEDETATPIVVLDQVTDPHNVGAVLRSAAAFGAAAVVVQDRHSPASTGTLAKAASGALDVVPLVRVTNLSRALDLLREHGVWCVGLAGEAEETLSRTVDAPRVALVLGAEGSGLRRLTRERCQAVARLPTRPPIASLNVSNAAAIALYEVARRATGDED